VLWPGLATPKLGLYAAAPMAAFFVELFYGVFCWYVYRGGRGLLASSPLAIWRIYRPSRQIFPAPSSTSLVALHCL
jgi:hypothetical protein